MRRHRLKVLSAQAFVMVAWAFAVLIAVVIVQAFVIAVLIAWLCKGTKPGTKPDTKAGTKPGTQLELKPLYGYNKGTARHRAGAVNAWKHE